MAIIVVWTAEKRTAASQMEDELQPALALKE